MAKNTENTALKPMIKFVNQADPLAVWSYAPPRRTSHKKYTLYRRPKLSQGSYAILNEASLDQVLMYLSGIKYQSEMAHQKDWGQDHEDTEMRFALEKTIKAQEETINKLREQIGTMYSEASMNNVLMQMEGRVSRCRDMQETIVKLQGQVDRRMLMLDEARAKNLELKKKLEKVTAEKEHARLSGGGQQHQPGTVPLLLLEEVQEKNLELKKEIHKLKKVFRLAAEKYFAQLETANKEVESLQIQLAKERKRVDDMLAVARGTMVAIDPAELKKALDNTYCDCP